MKLNPILIAVALCWLGAPAQADEVRRPYIVQLGEKPVAAYGGGVDGYAATKPVNGQQLDLSASHVQLYAQHLAERQASVMATVAGAPVQYQYQLALNGFAAMLTDAEVRALKARSDVAAVSADGRRHLLTDYTPTFLGLDKPGGLWSQLGGTGKAGEDVVIGVLDTGVWPENPSYSDRVDSNGNPSWDGSATLAYGAPPAAWKGSCATGEGFQASHCNNKLIGAQYYMNGFLEAEGALNAGEFRSARDSNGHGTHTSTTAGGNNSVEATVNGMVMGKTSGMAPRARLAAYKVCWSGESGAGCYASDSVAAVEQAIRDGVNVLSYSISGGFELDDPVDLAFLNAGSAGIFVSAAAGNEGPKHYTLSHQSPWVTTVAASTHDAQLLATLTLGSGKQFKGLSLNKTALPQTPMILAQDAAVPGVDFASSQLCYSKAYNGGVPQLDPDKVKGKIVVCLRGLSPRLDKSDAVKEAGGVGMVLVDNGDGPLAEVHAVPTVHLERDTKTDITSYVMDGGAKGAISAFSHVTGNVPAPVVAGFSSRGPNTADLSILKPDISAPGVDILAGVAPLMDQAQHDQVAAGTGTVPPEWAYYSGTSMATPHVAGIAALLHQLHPGWSPAMIKSAMQTTATPTLPDGFTGHTYTGTMPWAQGSGQIVPNSAVDPGLVYDADQSDYARYLCNAGWSAQCAGGMAPSFNLNLPTITAANIADSAVVSRRVTNVGSSKSTYTAQASLTGYEVTVTPSSLTLAPGASASFNVTLKRSGAKDYEWQFGKLVWSDGSHTVTSSLIAAPGKLVDSPSPVTAEKASGARALSVLTSYNGKLKAVVAMKPVTRASYDVAQAPFNSVDSADQITAACKAGQAGVRLIPVTLPAGTLAARFELFNSDTGDGGNHDLDMALLDAQGKVWGMSRLQGSNERMELQNPTPGAYKVCVVGNWIANNLATTFQLSSAIVTGADTTGLLKAMMPTKVYAGQYATVGLSWSGLAAQQRYFGAVQFTDGAGALGGMTAVSIDTSEPVPVSYLSKSTPVRRAQ